MVARPCIFWGPSAACACFRSLFEMSQSLVRCESVPSMVGGVKRYAKGRQARSASNMAYSASLMQENALFDSSVERKVVEDGPRALEVATSIKSALDQRISRLESVVENLSDEVVYLRGRLRCLEESNEVATLIHSHMKPPHLCSLTVEPWEDPPKV